MSRLKIIGKEQSADGTTKYLWLLSDGNRIENNIFPSPNRNALAEIIPGFHWGIDISSQIGCNVRCAFCATGLQPVKRNLTAEEIYDQVILIKKDQPDLDFNFVIFAAMGEPLLNYENVIASARKMEGLGIETLSLSTSGVVPNIYRLANEDLDFVLHVSIHSSEHEMRSLLVPMNRTHPLEEVIRAARYYSEQKGSTVITNYLVFPGLNDTVEDANRLAKLLDADHFHVQLYLWNPIQGMNLPRATIEQAETFSKLLKDRGIGSHVFPSKGVDVNAGCGQLVTERSREPVSIFGELPTLNS